MLENSLYLRRINDSTFCPYGQFSTEMSGFIASHTLWSFSRTLCYVVTFLFPSCNLNSMRLRPYQTRTAQKPQFTLQPLNRALQCKLCKSGKQEAECLYCGCRSSHTQNNKRASGGHTIIFSRARDPGTRDAPSFMTQARPKLNWRQGPGATWLAAALLCAHQKYFPGTVSHIFSDFPGRSFVT